MKKRTRVPKDKSDSAWSSLVRRLESSLAALFFAGVLAVIAAFIYFWIFGLEPQ